MSDDPHSVCFPPFKNMENPTEKAEQWPQRSISPHSKGPQRDLTQICFAPPKKYLRQSKQIFQPIKRNIQRYLKAIHSKWPRYVLPRQPRRRHHLVMQLLAPNHLACAPNGKLVDHSSDRNAPKCLGSAPDGESMQPCTRPFHHPWRCSCTKWSSACTKWQINAIMPDSTSTGDMQQK